MSTSYEQAVALIPENLSSEERQRAQALVGVFAFLSVIGEPILVFCDGCKKFSCVCVKEAAK